MSIDFAPSLEISRHSSKLCRLSAMFVNLKIFFREYEKAKLQSLANVHLSCRLLLLLLLPSSSPPRTNRTNESKKKSVDSTLIVKPSHFLIHFTRI
jgi:hypothetical protein